MGAGLDFAQRCLLSGSRTSPPMTSWSSAWRPRGGTEADTASCRRGSCAHRYPYFPAADARRIERAWSMPGERGGAAPLASVGDDRRARPRRCRHGHPGPHPRADPRAQRDRSACACACSCAPSGSTGETLRAAAGLPETELLAAEDLDARDTAEHRLSPPAADFLAGRCRLALAPRRADRAQPARPDRLPQPRLLRRRGGVGGLIARPAATASRRPSAWSSSPSTPARRCSPTPSSSRRESGSCRLGSTTATPGEPLRPAALEPRGGSARRPASCSASARTSATRTGCSRCACSRRCASCHGWQGSLVLAGTHIAPGSSLELERELPGRAPRAAARPSSSWGR